MSAFGTEQVACPTDVLVAVPAHNEEDSIEACLDAVLAACQAARDSGIVRRTRIAVGAHRCTDTTEQRANRRLAGHDAVVVAIADPLPVGTVRTRIVDAALAAAPLDLNSWLFSTDADGVVPLDWIASTLEQAHATGAALVLGMTELDRWDADPAARRAYAEIISAGLSDQGHHHAYAANLAVRLSAYQVAGGFPGLPHGEEHGLAAAIRALDLPVLSTLSPRVVTSARMPGRADHGLSALLRDLAAEARAQRARF